MKGDERMRSDAYSQRSTNPTLVMPVLSAKRVFAYMSQASTSLGQRVEKDVDSRGKPGHDGESGWGLADADGNG
jgi:hypothetical protein